MIEVLMPQLAEGMEEGTVVAWLVEDGDAVSAGQELVEIETDKATMTYSAEREGSVRMIVAPGETVAVGSPIAWLLGAGDSEPEAPAERPTSIPVAAEISPALAAAAAEVTGAPLGSSARVGHPNRIKASPLARRLARSHGVELAGLASSGPAGRIVKRDVLAATEARVEVPRSGGNGRPPAPAEAPRRERVPAPEVGRRRLTRLEQVVAQRMVGSHTSIPTFTAAATVSTAGIVALRSAVRELADPVPSINDIIVKACALALRDHPRLNCTLDGDDVVIHARRHIGIAVATDDSLLVPTVFDADRMGLGELAQETRRLAVAARDGSIMPAEMADGTFTVSNLGMYGVSDFTAIINPPQVAILAVGTSVDGSGRPTAPSASDASLRLTLTCDHRIVYGVHAAQFLARLRDLLETPLTLTL